ncbi:hypothetical protein [Stenotrophomonas maltophilia]|nr:hypothetical protein [Stenotrophomonas maltophilia]
MTYIHPNDRVYALVRALTAATAQGEGYKSDMTLNDSQAVEK